MIQLKNGQFREKAQSYAKQLKNRRSWPRMNNQLTNNEPIRRKNSNDVMGDFPLKDYSPPKRHDAFRHQDYVTPRTQNTHTVGAPHSPVRNNLNNSYNGTYTNQQHHQQQHQQPQQYPVNKHLNNVKQIDRHVLPQDAYRTVDISPRSVTKELSASELVNLCNSSSYFVKLLVNC